jgi:hypothetical protein
VLRTSSSATRQSLAKNAVSHVQSMVSNKFTACRFKNQQVEALVTYQVLNRMVSLGTPRSEQVAVN